MSIVVARWKRGPALRRPAFSIITATYNSAGLFDRTMASLRHQTNRNFEWIVVDGASTDGTLLRIQQAQDLVSEWLTEPDRGIADAWNKGLVRAAGNSVLILNAGDTYDPTFLERISHYMEGTKIVCSHTRLLSEEGSRLGVLRAQPHKLYRGMHVPHNWCAVPRQFYQELGPYTNLPVAMDFDWFHRYYKRYGAAGFTVINEILGSYYLGGKSDIHFEEGLRASECIIVRNGGSPLLARLYRFAYTVKRMIRSWPVNGMGR